jgi:hypothetical protein
MEERERIRVIQEATQQLFTALDFEERLRRILQVAMQSVDAEGGSILLYEPSLNALVFRYVVGDKSHELQGMSLDVDEGIAGEVFRTGQPKLSSRPGARPATFTPRRYCLTPPHHQFAHRADAQRRWANAGRDAAGEPPAGGVHRAGPGDDWHHRQHRGTGY